MTGICTYHQTKVSSAADLKASASSAASAVHAIPAEKTTSNGSNTQTSQATAWEGGGKLSSVAKGHVKRYTIEEEYQRDGNYYVVIVAEISDQAPDSGDSIAAITESLGRPSFYVVSSDPEVARVVREVLAENDFEVSSVKADARYLLNADTSFREYDAMGGMKGMQTTIKVRISDRYSSDTLADISSNPDSSTEISDSEILRRQNSLRYAMEDLQPKLVKELRQQFVDQFNNGSKVLVTLKRFDRMRDVDELRTCLESLPLTKSVSVKPVQKSTAVYEVVYLGDPASLQLSVLKKSREYRLRGLRGAAINNLPVPEQLSHPISLTQGGE